MVTMKVPPEGDTIKTAAFHMATKPQQRFQSLAGSLETLISKMVADWENTTTAVPGSSKAGEILDGDGVSKPIHGQMRKAQLLFTELHSATRKTHSAIEGFRKKVSASKQSMDLNHLLLQNLLYERDHLSRETQLCKDFTMTELSKMEDAEEQGFLEDVDTLQTREEHARNLNILKDQKEKRINAKRELGEIQIRVKAANSAVGESNQYLAKLPDYLKEVEKALVPLRKNIPWRPGARRGRHEYAADLPGPLFTLYCQLEAYCDSVLSEEMEIEDQRGGAPSLVEEYGAGDGSEPALAPASVSLAPARAYVSAAAKAAAESPDEDPSKANGRASPSPGLNGSAAKRQKRHHRRGEDEDESNDGGAKTHRFSKREAGRAMLDALKPSPTEVVLTLNSIKIDAAGGARAIKGTASGAVSAEDSFTIRFCYLPALGIVAVSPPPSFPSSVLSNLFPNDTGRDTPNPTNHHGRAARAFRLGVFEYPGDVACRPYRWAQWLSGLHFPPTPVSFSSEASAGSGSVADGRLKAIEPSTRAVIAELSSRVRTQRALATQLKAIGDKGPACLAGFQDRLPLGKANSSNVEIRSWKEMSGSEVQQAAKSFQPSASQNGKDAPSSPQAGVGASSVASKSTVEAHDEWELFGARYFRGVVKLKGGQKKEADVEILVEVPVEYPLRPSRLSLKTKAASPDDTGSQDLRTIANEVNAHYDALLTEDVTCWDHLLSHQMILVMSCLATPSVDGFTGRMRRGRMRRKPVLFDRLQRTFVHR